MELQSLQPHGRRSHPLRIRARCPLIRAAKTPTVAAQNLLRDGRSPSEGDKAPQVDEEPSTHQWAVESAPIFKAPPQIVGRAKPSLKGSEADPIFGQRSPSRLRLEGGCPYLSTYNQIITPHIEST